MSATSDLVRVRPVPCRESGSPVRAGNSIKASKLTRDRLARITCFFLQHFVLIVHLMKLATGVFGDVLELEGRKS